MSLQTIFSTRRYVITGSRRTTNYLWACLISLGGAGFLFTGFLSFIQRNANYWNDGQVLESLSNKAEGFLSQESWGLVFGALPKITTPSVSTEINTILFFPQGLIMCFYGALGLLFGFYLWCTILWKVGNGFNEFDKSSGIVRIFRWGLPGKNRRIDLIYKIEEIESLRVRLKEGVNPRRAISLQIKGKGEIPLTRIGIPIALEDIEGEASELAQFLKVSLETFYQV